MIKSSSFCACKLPRCRYTVYATMHTDRYINCTSEKMKLCHKMQYNEQSSRCAKDNIAKRVFATELQKAAHKIVVK